MRAETAEIGPICQGAAPGAWGRPNRPTSLGVAPLTAPALRIVIEDTVAGMFDIETDLIRLHTRGRARVALARQVAMYLAHIGCGLSLTAAGDLFDRDRTTVAHACHVVEERREDPTFDRAIDLLEMIVTVLTLPWELECQAQR
jgi:hypothetical protein